MRPAKLSARDRRMYRLGLDAAGVMLRPIAQDWLNAMDADGAECTCTERDRCPRCRCVRVLRLTNPKRRKP